MEAHIGVTRFGEVKYIHPEDEYLSNWVLNTYSNQIETRDQTFSSKWLTNINIKYSIFNNLKLTLGGNNIFDVFPDRHIHSANVSNGIFRYSRRVSQFGLRGAFWFVKVGVRL
jgi:iron complex outermembrane receptor protein